MTTQKVKGMWNQVRGQIQKRWGRLTDGELEEIKGEINELVGLIQERYGYTRERAEHEVNDFFAKVSDEAPARLKNKVRDATQGVRQTAEKARHELDARTSAVTEEIEHTADAVQERVAETSDKLAKAAKAQAETASAQVQEVANEVRTEAKQATSKLESRVQSYPWKAIGVAFLSGLVAGLILVVARTNHREEQEPEEAWDLEHNN